jgi:hypothetical protein
MVKRIIQVSFALLFLLIGASALGNDAKAASYQVFKDVPKNHIYYGPIYSLYAKQAVSGYYGSATNWEYLFKPKNNVTRAEAAQMISHTLGLKAYDVPKINYRDVSSSAWYYDAIAALVGEGYLSGFNDNTIRPSAPLTRAQMARILADSYGYETTTANISHFKDVNKDKWYAPYVGALVANNITGGTTSTTFSPDKKITRQELAAFLDRAHNKVFVKDYNNGQIQNLISELQVKIDDIIQSNKPLMDARPPYSQIRDGLLQYAMEDYADGDLRYYFETSCTSCDHLLYDIPLEYDLYFNLLEHSDTRITVESVSPENEMDSGYFVEVSLVKHNGKWKIDYYDASSFDVRPLNISKEEAKEYLKGKLSANGNRNVDSMNYLYYDYSNDMYVFSLKDNGYDNDVHFDPNTGFYSLYY